MNLKAYLDNNATTFCLPKVVEEMQRVLSLKLGNPSSVHESGQQAKALLIDAQNRIIKALGIESSSIVFTSGGTESLNHCLRGLVNSTDPQSSHIVSTTLEHSAVESVLSYLEKKSVKVDRVAVTEVGAVSIEALEAVIKPNTTCISVIAANNETGVKNDLQAIAELGARYDIPVIIDGVAWLGKELIPSLPGKVFWCFSAHKIHGPVGVGLTLIPKGTKLTSLILGGPQQQGRRGGTENVPAICGCTIALEWMQKHINHYSTEVKRLRDRFEQQLTSSLEGVFINGTGPRVGNTSNLTFDKIDGETLLFLLDQEGIFASMGSACSSGALEPSRVLLKMGYPRQRVLSSLRFSLSSFTKESEIDTACEIIINKVKQLRS